MGGWEHLWAFAVFATIAAFTPGPNNIMLAASGVNFGLRRSLPHIFGITAGFLSVVIAAAFGLGGLFTLLPFLYDGLRLIALGFLIYIAYKIGSATPTDDSQLSSDISDKPKTSTPLGFWPAFLFQWMNPKALIVVFSAVTAYAGSGPQFWVSLISITFIFFLVTITSTLAWCALGVLIARLLSNRLAYRIFNITMAGLLVASLLPVLLTQS